MFLAHSEFGSSVNPIPTRKGRLSPPISTGTPNVFHLPASLHCTYLHLIAMTGGENLKKISIPTYFGISALIIKVTNTFIFLSLVYILE